MKDMDWLELWIKGLFILVPVLMIVCVVGIVMVGIDINKQGGLAPALGNFVQQFEEARSN